MKSGHILDIYKFTQFSEFTLLNTSLTLKWKCSGCIGSLLVYNVYSLDLLFQFSSNFKKIIKILQSDSSAVNAVKCIDYIVPLGCLIRTHIAFTLDLYKNWLIQTYIDSTNSQFKQT